MSWLSWFAVEFAVPLAWALLVVAASRAERPRLCLWWALAAAGSVAWALAAGDWGDLPAPALSGALALLLWWWSRRKGRKRAAKPLGAKARALREKLTRSMPRWSPRLVPQRIPA